MVIMIIYCKLHYDFRYVKIYQNTAAEICEKLSSAKSQTGIKQPVKIQATKRKNGKMETITIGNKEQKWNALYF